MEFSVKIDFGEFADKLREFFGSDYYRAYIDNLPKGGDVGLHAGLLIAYDLAEDLAAEDLCRQVCKFENLRQSKYKEICDSAHDAWQMNKDGE